MNANIYCNSTRLQEQRDESIFKRPRTPASVPSALQQANFARRSFVEKQLALHLAQFASANTDLGLGQNQVENLVGTLIVSCTQTLQQHRAVHLQETDSIAIQAEAPSAVVEEYTAAEDAERTSSSSGRAIPPSPPHSEQPELSTEQRKELETLQELIRRKLECNKT